MAWVLYAASYAANVLFRLAYARLSAGVAFGAAGVLALACAAVLESETSPFDGPPSAGRSVLL